MSSGFWSSFAGTVLTQCVTAGLAAWAVIRTRRRDTLERLEIPRAQIGLECQFFGPIGGLFVAEVRIVVENKGHTLRHFKQVRVTIRGLVRDTAPALREIKGIKQIDFSEELFRNEGVRSYTVEPGVCQILMVPALIPDDAGIVLVHVKIIPGEELSGAPYFTEARIFPVRVGVWSPSADKRPV